MIFCCRLKPNVSHWNKIPITPTINNVQVFLTTQQLSFEEKLLEANTLIEKVRETLNDLGKGIYKRVQEANAIKSNENEIKTQVKQKVKCPEKCCYGVCSFHDKINKEIEQQSNNDGVKAEITDKKGEDKTDSGESIVEIEEIETAKIEQDEVVAELEELQSKEFTVTEAENDVKQKIGLEVIEEDKEESNESIPKTFSIDEGKEKIIDDSIEEDVKELKSVSEDASSQKTENEEEIEQNENEVEKSDESVESEKNYNLSEENKSIPEENKDSVSKEIITIKPVHACCPKQTIEASFENVHMVQEGLDPIQEISESDIPSEKVLVPKKNGLLVPVARMERATSPINIAAAPEACCQKLYEMLLIPENFTKAKENVSKLITEASVSEELNSISNLKFSKYSESFSDVPFFEKDELPTRKSISFVDDSIKSISQNVSRASSNKNVSIASSSNEKSKERVSKTSKLSVQVMPPVSIRSGFVMQKTLHLSIKPTGSVCNDVGKTQNIAYEEIRTELDTEKKICPEECKDAEGYCKGGIKQVESESESIKYYREMRDKVRSGRVSGLDEDAIIMFRSFQILDDEVIKEVTAVGAAAAASYSDGKSDSLKKVRSGSGSGNSVKKVAERKKIRSPWALGFYKTVGIQCDYVPVLEGNYQPAEPKIESKDTFEINQIMNPSGEGHIESPKLEVPSEEPVRDMNFSMDEILKILKGDQSPRAGGDSKDTFRPTDKKDEGESSHPKSEEPKEQLNQKKNKSDNASSSSSSLGSFDPLKDGSSFLPDRNFQTLQRVGGVKRPHQDDAEETMVASVDVAEKEKKEEDKDKYKQEGEMDKDEEITGEPKETTDENVQVVLDSSSSEDVSDIERGSDSSNTVKHFIRGLTGTSREQLEMLKSTASFARRSEIWAHPSNSSSSSRKKKEDTSDYTESREEFIDSLIYGDKQEGAPSDDNKNKTVMMAGIEGGDIRFSPKNNLPFYRKLLGKVVEISPKKQMEKSFSESTSRDESVSEGEIKCKSCYSIGEIPPYKSNEKKKGCRYLEERDKSLKIARQRMQYNNWVAYYLQKQKKIAKFDDSSFSGSSKHS